MTSIELCILLSLDALAENLTVEKELPKERASPSIRLAEPRKFGLFSSLLFSSPYTSIIVTENQEYFIIAQLLRFFPLRQFKAYQYSRDRGT
jgi:hypothetical protein